MSGPLRLVPEDGDALPEIPRVRTGRTRPGPASGPAATIRPGSGPASGPSVKIRPGAGPGAGPSATTRRVLAPDPADELVERLVEQIAVAVHPDEVAALLESDGLTAERIVQHYGRPDLFTLAEDLFTRVPRHYAAPPPGPDLWRADPVRCALRGLVFALPGLAYVLGARLWSGRPDLTGVVAAALLAWAVNQGLSHRAYLRLAAEGPAAAARTLRLGAPASALVSSALGLALCGPSAPGAFAAGQSVYLAAASALLVLGRERALLLGLLPVAAGAGATTLWPLPAAVGLVMLLGTVALTARAAWLALRETQRTGDAARSAPPLLSSLPFALFGLAAGLLAALAGLLDPRTVVVLTLSMGLAEWLLYRYRSLAVAALRSTRDQRGFAHRSGLVLALCLGGYLAVLWGGARIAETEPLPLLCLGAVFWTALLLQAFAVAWFPALVTLTAAGAQAAARATELPSAHVQLIGTGLAAAVLTGGTFLLLARPTAHR